MGVGNRRQREREERRSDILDVAERIFADRGFAATTMGQVAAGVELSKGTLYLYFTSKDELYVATCLRFLGRLIERYEAVASATASGLETLRALGNTYVEFARDNRDHFRLGVSWMLTDFKIDPETRNYADYRSLIQRLFGITYETIEIGKSDGSIRRDLDSRTFAFQTWGGTLGMLLLSLNREEIVSRVQQEIDFDELVPSFIDRMMDSIKGEST